MGVTYAPFRQGFAWGGEFAISGEPCQTAIYSPLYGPGGPPLVEYQVCTVEEAKAARTFKGKKVTLRATVREVLVGDGEFGTEGELGGGRTYKRVPFGLTVTNPSVDGFLPASERPKDKK